MGLFGPKGGAQGSPPKGLYKQREGAPKNPSPFTIHRYCSRNAAMNSSRVALQCLPSFAPKPEVAFADLAVRIVTLLLVRVDTLEVLHLQHKDEPHVRRFSQLHYRLPSVRLHRRATEVPHPRA